MVLHGTQCTDWDCGLFRRVPRVQIGMVDGLERCPEYGWVCEKSCSNQLRTGSRD
jgi:hypothetical protein